MTTHERIVSLRRALKDGTPLEFRTSEGVWIPAPPNITAGSIKRKPLNFRIKT